MVKIFKVSDYSTLLIKLNRRIAMKINQYTAVQNKAIKSTTIPNTITTPIISLIMPPISLLVTQ